MIDKNIDHPECCRACRFRCMMIDHPVPAHGRARVYKKGDRWHFVTRQSFYLSPTWQGAMGMIERYKQ